MSLTFLRLPHWIKYVWFLEQWTLFFSFTFSYHKLDNVFLMHPHAQNWDAFEAFPCQSVRSLLIASAWAVGAFVFMLPVVGWFGFSLPRWQQSFVGFNLPIPPATSLFQEENTTWNQTVPLDGLTHCIKVKSMHIQAICTQNLVLWCSKTAYKGKWLSALQ